MDGFSSPGDYMLAFQDALTQLGHHAAMMDNEEHGTHVDCLYCETMLLLARVVNFGEQLRKDARA